MSYISLWHAGNLLFPEPSPTPTGRGESAGPTQPEKPPRAETTSRLPRTASMRMRVATTPRLASPPTPAGRSRRTPPHSCGKGRPNCQSQNET